MQHTSQDLATAKHFTHMSTALYLVSRLLSAIQSGNICTMPSIYDAFRCLHNMLPSKPIASVTRGNPKDSIQLASAGILAQHRVGG